MAQCKVCGEEEKVMWRNRSQMFLCAPCHSETPRKVSRETFLKVYFPEGVDAQTGREFYDDYKTSRCTLEEYIQQTTTVVI